MKIHISAKFSTSELSFHDDFTLQLSIKQITEQIEKIKGLAIQRFKRKCDEYFKIGFADMVEFRMYWFDPSKDYDKQEMVLFEKKKE